MGVYELSGAGSLKTSRTLYTSMNANNSYGAMVPIAQVAFPSDGAAYTSYGFSNIPQTYQDLFLVTSCRDASSYASVYNPLWFNNVASGTGYSETQLVGDGSSASSSRWTNQSFFQFTNQPAGTSPAGTFSANTMHILNYANTTTFKTILTRNSYDLNGSGSSKVIVGTYASTAAITSIAISPNLGFKAGTTMTLYGIRASNA